MKKSVLLDTNIILDLFLDRKPFSESAAIIFKLANEGEISAFVTPLSFSNCYYVLRKLASHQKVIEKLSQLLAIVDVTTMNKQSLKLALKSGFNDFEDALQYYSALSTEKLDAIITRNPKDFKKSQIAVLSPDTFIRLFTGTPKVQSKTKPDRPVME